MMSCIVVDGSILKVPWCVYLWYFLSCFIIQQKNFASCLKISKMEFWGLFSFSEKKWNHEVILFGYNSSKWRTNWKFKIQKNAKYVFNIHVSDNFDILFWCCWWINFRIFDKVNSKVSLECLVFSFLGVWLWMINWWEKTCERLQLAALSDLYFSTFFCGEGLAKCGSD